MLIHDGCIDHNAKKAMLGSLRGKKHGENYYSYP